ncbi:MAG: IMP cyclohydrolase [Acutalibacteraceae bacterium]
MKNKRRNTWRYFLFYYGKKRKQPNRVFVEDGLGIKTKAFDESKDRPISLLFMLLFVSLVILRLSQTDQTDTIYDALEQGRTFEDALRTRTFEPDAPNFTLVFREKWW